MSAIDQGRYTVAAGSVGLAVAPDASVKYAHERKTFGEEIGRHQLVKQMLARMEQGIQAGRLLVWKAGWLKNAGQRSTRETSLGQWFCTDHAVQSAMDAIQVHGAYGYSDEYPVERYLRNSKGSVIYEGTSQIHTVMQADYLLGYRIDKPLRMPQPAGGRVLARLYTRRREPDPGADDRTDAARHRRCRAQLDLDWRMVRGLRLRHRPLAWWPLLLVVGSLFFLVPILFSRPHAGCGRAW